MVARQKRREQMPAVVGFHLSLLKLGLAYGLRFSSFSSWQEAWQNAGTHDAGEGAENFPSRFPCRKRKGDTGPGLSL